MILLADMTITFDESVFEHAGHLAVLVNVTDLRRCLETCFVLVSFSHFFLLGGKSSFELLSFSFDLGHSSRLFFHLSS